MHNFSLLLVSLHYARYYTKCKEVKNSWIFSILKITDTESYLLGCILKRTGVLEGLVCEHRL